MNRKSVAIIAHSNIDWISKDTLKDYSVLIGVDRGAYALLNKGMVPDVAIGDFDSVSEAEMEEIRTKIANVRQYPSDKDQTDLELALMYAFSLDPAEIALFGVTGGRLDHSLAALHLLETMHEHNVLGSIFDAQNRVTLVSGKYQIVKQNQFRYLSILPLSAEIIISIVGCQYPLDHRMMKKGTTLGVSNVITSEVAEITIHQGVAFCISSRDGKYI